MFITTGGVSVGDYDHIRPVAEALGVHTIFHKVAQKPGKPMYFGKKDDTLFFGLPGNPRSVMMGFWVHVLPMLHAMSGKQSQGLREGELPLGQDLRLKGDRTEMLAVKILDGMVHVARKQNSHMLSTLVDADGIGLVPAVQRELAVGDAIKVLSFT
jgi:molybdopterin molybdotransferase